MPQHALQAALSVAWLCMSRWTQGVHPLEIQELVMKKDGTHPKLNAIDKVIAHKIADPDWQGEESSAGGRPPILTTAEQKKVVQDRTCFGHSVMDTHSLAVELLCVAEAAAKPGTALPKLELNCLQLVFKHRGKAVVTMAFCRKQLSFLKTVTDNVVSRVLHKAPVACKARLMVVQAAPALKLSPLPACRLPAKAHIPSPRHCMSISLPASWLGPEKFNTLCHCSSILLPASLNVNLVFPLSNLQGWIGVAGQALQILGSRAT